MILIDDRVGSLELTSYFPAGLVSVQRLEYGDASFSGEGKDGVLKIGLERKTLHDLLQSADTGRLQGHQIPGLMSAYDRVYLIVEGMWRPDQHGIIETWGRRGWQPMAAGSKRFQASALDGLVNTLSVMAGFMVRQTVNIRHTAQLIMHLYRWWQKPWDKHRGHVGFHRVTPSVAFLKKPSLLRRVAKELPGVGWEKSGGVEAEFTSVLDMVLSDWPRWVGIPGIGKVMAQRIVKALQEPGSP